LKTLIETTNRKDMYYAEQIIDGVLHYRHAPDAEWIPFNLQMLTKKNDQLRARVAALENFLKMTDECLDNGIPIEKNDPIHNKAKSLLQ
jgi:hypothetical protein